MPTPFDEFVDYTDEYVPPREGALFRSKSSAETLRRYRAPEWIKAGIAAYVKKRLIVKPDAVDQHILDFMRRGEGFKPPAEKAAA